MCEKNKKNHQYLVILACGLLLVAAALLLCLTPRGQAAVGRVATRLSAFMMSPSADATTDADLPLCLFAGDADTIYRAPGMVTTSSGTLLAYCERRDGTGLDTDYAPSDIVYRRSTDGGTTWEDVTLLVEGRSCGITAHNPVMIAASDGVLHFFYTIQYGLEEGGVYYCVSDDDGATWSAAIDLTAVTVPELRNAIATGPGHGIQLSDGTLILTLWMVLKERGVAETSHYPSVVSTLYSTDGGATWQMGEIIGESDTVGTPCEAAIVELSDGSVMINCRNYSKCRAIAYSPTGYSDWTALVKDTAIIDPNCYGSLIAYDATTLLFVNPESTEARANVTVKISHDDGTTWEHLCTLVEGDSAYADLTVGADQRVYALIEQPEEDTVSMWLYAVPIE